jgi:DNA-binding response OmpR family regulator
MTDSKLLVVEDDPNLLETLRYNLSQESYDVVTASDGEQAIAVARRERPDLIILDIMLPKLSGFEVCRILRKEMTVPILMLTARADEMDKIVGRCSAARKWRRRGGPPARPPSKSASCK